MADKDNDPTTDETVEQPAVEAEAVAEPEPAAATTPPIAPAPWYGERRGILVGAGGIALLVLVFFAGMAVGRDHHDRGRFEEVRGARGFEGGPGMRGGGGPGGMPGGGRGMQGGAPGGAFGGRGGHDGPGGGFGGRGGHGGAGVVENVSDDELTVAPLGGRIDELTVALDDDTEVKRSGDDGPRDLEDAKVSDIDEGDIVMVLGAPGDVEDPDDEDTTTAAVDAKVVVILRDGDE